MKKTKQQIVTCLLLQFILFAGLVEAGRTAPGDGAVMKAFKLRLDGKANEAKELLLSTIAKDSTNAMAYYELARLNHYLMIGGGNMKMDDILTNIEKATNLAPENVIYAYYKALAYFLNAFMAMQQQKQDLVKPRLAETCKAFEEVLAIKPDYYEARLYLVEIYGMLPKEMGGDSIKAVAYTDKLMQENTPFGAKAKADLLPEDTDLVKYWQIFFEKDKTNPDILAELGVSYLRRDDYTNAEKYFRESMKMEPSMNYHMLDLARAPMYRVMQNQDLAKELLPIAINYVDEYLKTIPEPIVPLKAYALGLKSRFEQFMGNKEEGDKILDQAKALDPYFSRASGVPTLLLFDKPDQVSHTFFSFFSPF